MRTEYRIEFAKAGLLADGIFWHAARWILLLVVTGGAAILFYPYFFVKFITDRVTIVKITEEEQVAAAADLQATAQNMGLSESAQEKRAESTEDSSPA
ncbi:MAG: hypothetical protein OXJ55_07285 [Caldilineaceae bacterium]|nr:hypothetical protein [Caldilineaceae bacterium]MDE0461706.1 hypothetical protein [Caldilineaceae bacterium]